MFIFLHSIDFYAQGVVCTVCAQRAEAWPGQQCACPTHTTVTQGETVLEGVTLPCAGSNQGLQPGARGARTYLQGDDVFLHLLRTREKIHTTMVGIEHRP